MVVINTLNNLWFQLIKQTVAETEQNRLYREK